MDDGSDHYETLGVPVDADLATITAAYRRLARQLHPDANADPAAVERFRAVTGAFAVLRDPERRAAYDRTRGVAGARPRAEGGYSITVRHVRPASPRRPQNVVDRLLDELRKNWPR